MSKPSTRRNVRPVMQITRRQQTEALRQMKAKEVASHVVGDIRSAVKQVVEEELGKIKTTMLSLIDRVLDLESNVAGLRGPPEPEEMETASDSNSNDRHEREETPSVPEHDKMAQGPHPTCSDSDSPHPG